MLLDLTQIRQPETELTRRYEPSAFEGPAPSEGKGRNKEFRVIAPELMADPKRSLYRIWRDTRFSADKRPLKTNVAAVFQHRLGTRHS